MRTMSWSTRAYKLERAVLPFYFFLHEPLLGSSRCRESRRLSALSVAPRVMSSDCVDPIRAYLVGGDRDGFGQNEDPFKKFSGGGGVDGLAKLLAVDVDVDDCPREDNRRSAMQLGMLVGKATNLVARDIMMIKAYMELAYEDHSPSFKTGLALAKEESKEGGAVKGGAHGGHIPNKKEAEEILAEKGMRWQEVVALNSVLFNGSVPTEKEIQLEGYGSDPAQWASAKESRKSGKKNIQIFLKEKDAKGYRDMLTKGATRLASNGAYTTASAMLMLFVQKLSKMTFDQGMAHLFLVYCEEHIEVHKGRGLASAANPLDADVLTETVLAEKTRARDTDEKLERVVEQLAEQNMSFDHKFKSKFGGMASKIANLEREFEKKQTAAGRNGPPGEDNACSYCKSPDHFIRDCDKKKAADAKKLLAKESAGSSE